MLILHTDSCPQIIVDGIWYEGHLPEAVEAFMYDDSGGQPFCNAWRGARTDTERVKRAHADFLTRYGYTRAQVPLLRYNGRSFEVYNDELESLRPGEQAAGHPDDDDSTTVAGSTEDSDDD